MANNNNCGACGRDDVPPYELTSFSAGDETIQLCDECARSIMSAMVGRAKVMAGDSELVELRLRLTNANKQLRDSQDLYTVMITKIKGQMRDRTGRLLLGGK